MLRASAFVSWIVLCAVAFGSGLPSRPDQGAWILDLLAGRWEGENPLVVAHFQLMGVWSVLAALLLADDWRARPVPAWPFVAGSMVLGCFALLPWFWLRPSPIPSGPPAPGWARGPLGPAVLGALALGLLGWGLISGDPAAYATTFWSDSFVWAMAFDFVAFFVLFAAVARARAEESRVPWAVTLIPVVGAAAWLAGRRGGAPPGDGRERASAPS